VILIPTVTHMHHYLVEGNVLESFCVPSLVGLMLVFVSVLVISCHACLTEGIVVEERSLSLCKCFCYILS
jgi:hypothetical protein